VAWSGGSKSKTAKKMKVMLVPHEQRQASKNSG
jgi:hypothetical protein